MRSALRYALAAAAIAALVGWAGSALVEPGNRDGVWVGAGVAAAVQAVLFWLLFVRLLPQQRGIAHALGVLGRFGVVGVMALVWIPYAGLPLAPTLFSLVTVFFVTTLVEPLFLQPVLPAASSGDAATTTTRR